MLSQALPRRWGPRLGGPKAASTCHRTGARRPFLGALQELLSKVSRLKEQREKASQQKYEERPAPIAFPSSGLRAFVLRRCSGALEVFPSPFQGAVRAQARLRRPRPSSTSFLPASGWDRTSARCGGFVHCVCVCVERACCVPRQRDLGPPQHARSHLVEALVAGACWRPSLCNRRGALYPNGSAHYGGMVQRAPSPAKLRVALVRFL